MKAIDADPFEVKERHREVLSALSNVIGVGVGPKIVDGKPAKAIAIKVYVQRKVTKEQLAEGECVPEELEGVPTDVEEMGPISAYSTSINDEEKKERL